MILCLKKNIWLMLPSYTALPKLKRIQISKYNTFFKANKRIVVYIYVTLNHTASFVIILKKKKISTLK